MPEKALSPERKVDLLTALGVIVLVLMCWFSYWSTARLFKAFDLVYHTHQVLEKIGSLTQALSDAQRSTRGYAITGQDQYLEPYKTALDAIPGALSEIASLTLDNPAQQQNINILRPEIDAFLKMSAEIIAIRSTPNGEQKASAYIRSGQGMARLNDVMKTLEEMNIQENTLLSVRNVEEKLRAQIIQWAIFLITAFAACMLVLAGINIRRHIQNEKSTAQKLREKDLVTMQLLEGLPIGVFVTEADGKPYYLNKSGVDLLGRNLMPQEKLGNLMERYQLFVAGTNQVYPVEEGGIGQALKGKKTIINDIEIHQPDGKIIPIEAWGTPIFDSNGRLTHAAVAFMDISDRKKHISELVVLSLHDELTGLLNRRGFMDSAHQQIKLADHSRHSLHMFFIDLDNLKKVNDTMGHQAGDEMITAFSNHLSECLRKKDILARIGGDEFAVLIEDQNLDSQTIARRLREEIETRTNSAGRYRLDFSIGYSTYNPSNPSDLERLISQADEQMYEEKRKKKGNSPA